MTTAQRLVEADLDDAIRASQEAAATEARERESIEADVDEYPPASWKALLAAVIVVVLSAAASALLPFWVKPW
jgi:hypothetical protein